MDETITGNTGNYLDVFASSNLLNENLMKFVNFFFPISFSALFIVFFFHRIQPSPGGEYEDVGDDRT